MFKIGWNFVFPFLSGAPDRKESMYKETTFKMASEDHEKPGMEGRQEIT